MTRFEIPDGWTVQASQFALDCTPEQAACVRRQFGGRRYARNWAVRTLKEDLPRYQKTGAETAAPSLAVLRKRRNQVKDTECVDADSGQAWWPQISKEAFADGIKAAVDAYRNWQTSRAGKRQGGRVGFPRFAKKGRDRVTFTPALGPVGAAVERGAGRKTRPGRAGGDEARKGPSQQAGKQPRDGAPASDSP
jgi:putative transposase